MTTDNIIPVRDNPQFNVGLIARHVCVACNKKLITELRDTLSSVEDYVKDFEDFIDHVNLSMTGDTAYYSTGDYQITQYDGVWNISMKQDFAKDISFCTINAIRQMDRHYPVASALIAFSKKLDLASDGDYARLQGSPKQQQLPYQFMMIPNPNGRKFNNNSSITGRKYGQ